MMEAATVSMIQDLDDRVQRATSQFYNRSVAGTVHDPALGHVFGDQELSVTDILLVAALSQVHVLLTGPAGVGKTDLAKLFCQGLFGSDGWFMQRLNPNLTEEVFCDIDMKTLAKRSIRKAVLPAPFLSLACTILDECNRTPPALTNMLLGFCDGRIELKCGLKHDVGRAYRNNQGEQARYHMVIGSMNEGKEYAGTFEVDAALSRRLTLRVPFGELRPTPHDLWDIIEQRTGHASPVRFSDASEQVARASEAVVRMPLDPLAFLYLAYLGNVGRCPHSVSGFHPRGGSQELCAKTECRIQKRAEGFCPSVSGLCEGVLIFLKRAACGLAALRAARTVRAISETCEGEDAGIREQLGEFVGVQISRGSTLRKAAVARYLSRVSVTAEDIKVMLPFVGLGGKVRMSAEYIGKRFQGSEWFAMKNYVRETYGQLEEFLRQNQALFQQLDGPGDAAAKIMQRLEHAERFSDPAIRCTIAPLLERRGSAARARGEVEEEIKQNEPVRSAAAIVCMRVS